MRASKSRLGLPAVPSDGRASSAERRERALDPRASAERGGCVGVRVGALSCASCRPSPPGPPPLAPLDDAADVATDAPDELAGATELPWLWLDAVDTTRLARPSPNPSPSEPIPPATGGVEASGRCPTDPDARRSDIWLWLADADPGRGGSAYGSGGTTACLAVEEAPDARRVEAKNGEDGEGG